MSSSSAAKIAHAIVRTVFDNGWLQTTLGRHLLDELPEWPLIDGREERPPPGQWVQRLLILAERVDDGIG
jgi:hypothetical protein